MAIIEKEGCLSSIDKTAAVTAEIRNCNNISSGKVSWEKGKLNIKYGLNGTGKTTIGKAIIASSKIKSELHHVEYTLESLRPYGTEDDESKKTRFNNLICSDGSWRNNQFNLYTLYD